MEGLTKIERAKQRDDLEKLCDEMAALATCARRVETILDSLVDRREHEGAKRMLRVEIANMIEVHNRCKWNGDG